MQEEAPPKLHTRAGPTGEDYDDTLCGEPGFRIGYAYLQGVMPLLKGYQTCVECAALAAWLYRHPEVVAYMRELKRAGRGEYAMDSRD
jgi:hypothetical protein